MKWKEYPKDKPYDSSECLVLFKNIPLICTAEYDKYLDEFDYIRGVTDKYIDQCYSRNITHFMDITHLEGPAAWKEIKSQEDIPKDSYLIFNRPGWGNQLMKWERTFRDQTGKNTEVFTDVDSGDPLYFDEYIQGIYTHFMEVK